MQELDLEKLHEKTYELAREFHKICVKNNLKYYMIGGTMLGAVREHNFIPWDDDMDIAMPRKDYDKLLRNADKIHNNILKIEYPKNEKYPWSYARVFHKGTTLIQGMFNYPGGVFIDLYPLDNAGSNPIVQALYLFRFKVLHTMVLYSNKSDRFNGNKNPFLVSLARKKTSLYWKKITDKMLRKQNKFHVKYVANFYGIYGKKEIIPVDVFGNPKLYSFRDSQFYGVEKSDMYLTNLYGKDYMTPPPPSVRKNTRHSVKYVNFEESYLK